MVDTRLLEYLRRFVSEERQERFREVLRFRTRYLTVATEDVYQMHNASAVLRSCEVFGLQDAHFIDGKYGDKIDRKIARGAQKWVDVHRHKDVQTCMENLRSAGYKIVATTPHSESSNLESFPLDQKTALFFGTEKDGLSPEVMERADAYLTIPMVGFTESLNISVAVAIILQRLTTRLRESGVNWELTEEEKLFLEMEWTKKSIKSLDAIVTRYQREHDR